MLETHVVEPQKLVRITRELSVGKSIPFQDRGPIALRGFDDPVRLFEVPLTPAP